MKHKSQKQRVCNTANSFGSCIVSYPRKTHVKMTISIESSRSQSTFDFNLCLELTNQRENSNAISEQKQCSISCIEWFSGSKMF